MVCWLVHAIQSKELLTQHWCYPAEAVNQDCDVLERMRAGNNRHCIRLCVSLAAFTVTSAIPKENKHPEYPAQLYPQTSGTKVNESEACSEINWPQFQD